MKLAVVVQRYGADLNGGAELHARYIAERLADHADVEVLTTCARDYITWRNEFQPGSDQLNGLPVRRFEVSRERNPNDFGRRSEYVFRKTHSLVDELSWLRAEGPTSPSLINYVRRQAFAYDYFIFFSYRYYLAYHGIRSVASRAVLVPTAERDPALGLSIFAPAFRNVRAVMYNSFEERALIQHVSGNNNVPGVVVGVGSEVPDRPCPRRFRERTGIRGRFAVYVGRIDENKGCGELVRYFRRYAASSLRCPQLVLVGQPVMAVPSHSLIHHLGFVTDEEKFDAMAASDLLIMPSYFESLSIVTLEAWALSLPVLANGKCNVLRGQAIRSNAGLYYNSYEEFAEAFHVLWSNHRLREALGRNGRAYFKHHYTWPVVIKKYLNMLDRLHRDEREGIQRSFESLPGWLARRRRTVPPAKELVDALPNDAVAADEHAESC